MPSYVFSLWWLTFLRWIVWLALLNFLRVESPQKIIGHPRETIYTERTAYKSSTFWVNITRTLLVSAFTPRGSYNRNQKPSGSVPTGKMKIVTIFFIPTYEEAVIRRSTWQLPSSVMGIYT